MSLVRLQSKRKWIEFTLAGNCPVSCCYCPQGVLARSYSGCQLMSPDTFSACLSNIPKDFEIHFSGFVEPWLNPSATSFLRLASLEGRTTRVYSTLLGMNQADIQALIDCQTLTRLCVHTVDASGLMRFKANEEYYQHIALLTNGFRNRSELLRLMVIGAPDPKVIEIAGRAGFKLQSSLFRETVSRAGNVKTLKEAARILGPIMCSRQRSLHNNVVLPNGDMVLCCCDYSLQHRLGNLCNQPYGDIYSQGISSILRMQAEPDSDLICRKCEWATSNERDC